MTSLMAGLETEQKGHFQRAFHPGGQTGGTWSLLWDEWYQRWELVRVVILRSLGVAPPETETLLGEETGSGGNRMR